MVMKSRGINSPLATMASDASFYQSGMAVSRGPLHIDEQYYRRPRTTEGPENPEDRPAITHKKAKE